MFGKVVGFDPRLLEISRSLESLAVRELCHDALFLISPDGRLVSIMMANCGRGPDRILVERIPEELPKAILIDKRKKKPLPDKWHIADGRLFFQNKELLAFTGAIRQSSEVLAEIRDFPGHTRMILGRQVKPGQELKTRLEVLAKSIRLPMAEAIEEPLLNVLGYGKGRFPAGDAALCGMLLTGKAFAKGGRLRADWQTRLAFEIKRFFQRTTPFSAAHLRFSMEGRTLWQQETLFDAMAKDYETKADVAIQAFLSNQTAAGGQELLPGTDFLFGVMTAMDLCSTESEQESSLSTPLETQTHSPSGRGRRRQSVPPKG